MNFGLSYSIAFNQSYYRNFFRNLKLIKNPKLTTTAGSLEIVLMLCMSHMLFALSLTNIPSECTYITWEFPKPDEITNILVYHFFVIFYSRLSCSLIDKVVFLICIFSHCATKFKEQ